MRKALGEQTPSAFNISLILRVLSSYLYNSLGIAKILSARLGGKWLIGGLLILLGSPFALLIRF